MSDLDDQDRRLQAMHELRGVDLIDAIVKELVLLSGQVTQLRREMAAYRDFGATRDRWLDIESPSRTRAQLPKTVAIDASQMLHPRHGFYGLEFAQHEVPFCWTGPSPNFSFDIFIDRTNGAELELRAVNVMDFERQKDIRLYVDGDVVVPTIVRNARGLILTAELPPREDDRGTNLVFTVPEVIRPDDPASKRVLGIAFTSLRVRAHKEPVAAPAPQPAVKSRKDRVVRLIHDAQNKKIEDDTDFAASDSEPR